MDKPGRERALKLWTEGKALEAGQLVFEDLPRIARPKWAAKILEAVVERTGLSSPATKRILSIVDDPRQWADGHAAFDLARDEVLRLSARKSRSASEELMLSQLMVAELVAKITYNETDPDDEFDADSGWWIAPCVKTVLEEIGDAGFERSIWLMLISDPLT